jgi:Lrp/AsnC family transcriptional regulator for asnA, asnC and gidA
MRKHKEKIDKVDCDIISLLQKDGRLSNTTIAKELGISEATVRTRLNRLLNEGFIQIVAVSNPIKLGFEVSGIISITIDSRRLDSITKALKQLEPVWYVVKTTGSTDIYTEFVLNSMDDLNDLIYNKINRIDGVLRTETSIILEFIKRDYDWGTAV